MKRSDLLACLFALCLACRAVAAPPPASTVATLNVFRWSSDADIVLINHAIQRFNQRYPHVTVKVQYGNPVPWGAYINQFVNMVDAGQAPDVVNMPIEGISTLVGKNMMRDLQPMIDNDPHARELVQGTDPHLIDGLRFKGKLCFFPNDWNNIVIYYNTDMFKAAGLQPPAQDWTWKDFLDDAEKLTRRDSSGHVTQYGYFVPGSNFALEPWLITNATDKLTADELHSNITDPKVRESLTFVHDLISKYKVSPAFTLNDVGSAAFTAKQVAMFSAGHWVVADLQKVLLGHYDIQYPPRNRTPGTVFGVGGNGITAASKQPALAWEFVKEIAGPAFQDEQATLMRSIPTLRSAGTAPGYIAIPANGKIYYESAAIAKPVQAPPNFAQVEDISMRHIDSYMTNNADLDSTISSLNRELTRAMSRVH